MNITACTYFRHIALALLVFAHAGCNTFDYDEQAPIVPLSGEAHPLSGFAAGEHASYEFEWGARGELLCLNIPESGEYLLTYTENHHNNSGLFSGFNETSIAASPSHIAFQADTPVCLYIRLASGGEIEYLQLQRGTIAADAIGLYDDGPVIRYATPSIPTIFWSDVFFLDPAAPPIFMRQRESVCSQNSARSAY